MVEETHIKELRPGLTPFPENVFVDDQPWLADHLWPTVSIDLGLLRPELKGTVVHMIEIATPFDGYIGDGTSEFHNEFTGPNWFALHLTEDNRYRFLGQEGYFAPCSERIAAAIKERQARIRAYAKEHGRLAEFPRSWNGRALEVDWLSSLGGDFWEGNWTVEPPPSAFYFDLDEASGHIELSYLGKSFIPVACADRSTTIMFYEPDSRVVLFTFDYS